jgi:hypothetical protein
MVHLCAFGYDVLTTFKKYGLKDVNLTKVICSYVLKMMDACCMKYHKECNHLC